MQKENLKLKSYLVDILTCFGYTNEKSIEKCLYKVFRKRQTVFQNVITKNRW